MPRDRYIIRERSRLGIFEVIDTQEQDAPVFVGLSEDCEEWIDHPESRDPGKPADYPFR